MRSFGMIRALVGGALALAIQQPNGFCQDGESSPPKSKRTAAASERVKALETEYQAALRAASADAGTSRSKASRRKAAPKQPVADGYAARMLAIAKEVPQQPAAFQALRWILQNQGGPKMEAVQEQAAAIVLRDHLAEAKLPELCSAAASSRSPAVETMLRGVLAQSPSHEAKGYACWSLGTYLKSKADWADYCQFADPHQRQLMASNPAGKAMLEHLAEVDAAALREESRRCVQRTAKEFADVPALRAVVERLRLPPPNEEGLPVGARAPETVGTNLDGKPMKLSDFHGKVLVIDFWGDWCVYSRANIQRQRALQSRMQGREFALLGVNSDPDPDAIKRRAASAGINWPSWRDGSLSGPIAKQWNVIRCPTTFVVDQQGVIRYKNLSGKELEDAVESLLKESEKGKH